MSTETCSRRREEADPGSRCSIKLPPANKRQSGPDPSGQSVTPREFGHPIASRERRRVRWCSSAIRAISLGTCFFKSGGPPPHVGGYLLLVLCLLLFPASAAIPI